MPKFFITPDALNGDEIDLTGGAAHHMLNVLRMKPGERAILCDGHKTDYRCVIEHIDPNNRSLALRVETSYRCDTEPPFDITIYQGMPKADKLEWVIQKCVELGANKIAPVICERTQTPNARSRRERWERVAEAAAMQSMRGIIPQVAAPAPFERAVETACEDVQLAAYEREQTVTVKRALKNKIFNSIGVWVGPEGGFTGHEIELLRMKRAGFVTLGKRVLRTETAGLAALVQILCVMEA